jgi:hypothetical protein
MKPHIRKIGLVWVCTGQGHTNYGTRPDSALIAWGRIDRDSARLLNKA